jgi:thiamine transporter ThiT
MKKTYVGKLVTASLFLALALVLPLLTGQLQQLGAKLLPMHIPVLLCGFICGWQYGLVVGFTAPLLRSAIFGMRFYTLSQWQWPSSWRHTASSPLF